MKRVFLCAFVGFLAFVSVAASVSFAGTTEVVSVNSEGSLGNRGSYNSVISADGRYVAFESGADNLVPGDTNNEWDVFVHDRQTGATEIVSKDIAGKPGNKDSVEPAISADGRYVAFRSEASNLVSGDTNNKWDVFVYDRQTGAMEIASKDSAGKPGNKDSSEPTISADGRYVAFRSWADNLVPGDTNNKWDVFVHDRQTGATELVSVDSVGNLANGSSSWLSISADGRYVAFHSEADNLVPDDTNGVRDVFVHDRQTGVTEIISVDSAGMLGKRESVEPAISADGRYVAFRSWADNLVPGDTNWQSDIFVRDRQTGATEIVSVDSAGRLANHNSYEPAISADGRFVAFASTADNLVPGDTNGQADTFVHDRQTGVTEIVSVNSFGFHGTGGGCSVVDISADGRYVTFESESINLVSDDTNGESDIFVRGRD